MQREIPFVPAPTAPCTAGVECGGVPQEAPFGQIQDEMTVLLEELD